MRTKGIRIGLGALAVALLGVSATWATAGAEPCVLLAPPDPSSDVPDDGYLDANGDGIDGMRCGPIFVAATGSDANIGTIDSPMRTIGAAILAARSHTPPRDVYISNGIYEGTVVLAEGVNLYGGYDAAADWTRSRSTRATIRLGPGGGDVALLAANLGGPATVDHLFLEAARDSSGQLPGITNAAALVKECAGPVTFRNCALDTRDGSDGDDGAIGSAGALGNDGGAGCRLPLGPRDGHGGLGSEGEINRGGRGNTGTGESGHGPSGGQGGGRGNIGSPGFPGEIGGSGLPGPNGLGAANPIPGANGEDGGSGAYGSGGGGGGGGGSGLCPISAQPCGYPGVGGGGGGGGGGGDGAPGGAAGGSSYGLILRAASIEIETSSISTSDGGRGGAGGAGGPGASGGIGGPGGPACYTMTPIVPCDGFIGCNAPPAGIGGPGGAGGAGGPGGSGGGGSGGNSIAILHLIDGSSTADPATTIAVGQAGLGGSSLGNGGANGVAAASYEASLSTIPIWPTCTPCCPPAAVHARLVVPGGSQASAEIVIPGDNGLEPAGSVTVLSTPAHGTASASGSVITYTAEPGFVGTDVFEFQACRACGPCATGFAVVFVGTTTSVSGDAGVKAFDFALGGSNPIRDRTSFRYSLPASVPVKVAVYSVTGQHVATLVDRVEGPGNYEVAFDLRGTGGRSLAPGVYLVRITAGNVERRVRMIALK